MRECGLKPEDNSCTFAALLVTPHAGVWIETSVDNSAMDIEEGHSPCGSVD